MLNNSWWMHQIKKKIKNASCKFRFVPSFCSWHLAVRTENEMLGCEYHIRVTDVYRVFSTFFISINEFHICFWWGYRPSSFFVIESQNILLFNASGYYLQYNKTKDIVKGFKSVYEDIQTRVEVNVSYIVLGKKGLKLLTTPQNRFINQNNSWLYC